VEGLADNLYRMTTQRNPIDRSGRSGSGVGTLLGIWAHPDDEAYLSSGLMFSAREAGQRVAVVTATRGELGTDDPAAWPPDRLAAARERELAASLAAVDVTEHHWLGYRDGTLPQVSTHRAVQQISRLMSEIQPDTIVTFGPDGMTGHSDHRTISRWVTQAWEAGGRRERLWYATFTPGFHRTWGELNTQVGLWFDGSEPPSDPPADLAEQVRCDGDMLDRKFAALAAHTSQTSGLISTVGAERYRKWWSTEYFVDARTRLDRRSAA
jgi:LmbE family N-acetylglucosaminyl deacetylase